MYMFPTEIVYANAFYATRDITPHLSEGEIYGTFCNLIERIVPEETKNDPTRDGSSKVIFAFDGTDELMSSTGFPYAVIGGYIFHLGGPVSEEELETVNLAFGFKSKLHDAFARAREEFATYISAKRTRQEKGES